MNPWVEPLHALEIVTSHLFCCYILVLQTDYTSHCLCAVPVPQYLVNGRNQVDSSKVLIKLVDTNRRTVKRNDASTGRRQTEWIPWLAKTGLASSVDALVDGNVDRQRPSRNSYHRNFYHSYHRNFVTWLSLLCDLTLSLLCQCFTSWHLLNKTRLYCPTFFGCAGDKASLMQNCPFLISHLSKKTFRKRYS